MDNDLLHWILLTLSASVLAVILARLLRRVVFGDWLALGIVVIVAAGAVYSRVPRLRRVAIAAALEGTVMARLSLREERSCRVTSGTSVDPCVGRDDLDRLGTLPPIFHESRYRIRLVRSRRRVSTVRTSASVSPDS
jgi:hypothetical protein